jgi:uncharacterized protein YdeI (BOF family)
MTGPGRALRELLLDALEGCDESLLERLGQLATWNAIMGLWEGGWLGGGKSSSRATRAQIRVRLREIADARRSIAELYALEAGTMVCVEGAIVEVTAHDLIVDDGSGELATARSEGAWWINPRLSPQPGDGVTLLGFLDLELDPSRAPDGPRSLPRRVVIRAAGLPLIAHLGALAEDAGAR